MKKPLTKEDQLLLDISSLVVLTDKGTLLRGATLRRIEHDLYAHCQNLRTGIFDMETTERKPRIIVSWNTIYEAAGVDAARGDLTEAQKKRVMNHVEKLLDIWETKRTQPTGVHYAPIEPAMLKKLDQHVHANLKARGNEMPFSALLYFVADAIQENPDSLKPTLSQYLKEDAAHYSVQAGPAAAIRRLKDKNDKETGLTSFPPRKGRGKSKKD